MSARDRGIRQHEKKNPPEIPRDSATKSFQIENGEQRGDRTHGRASGMPTVSETIRANAEPRETRARGKATDVAVTRIKTVGSPTSRVQ